MTAKRPPDLIHDEMTDRYSIVTRSRPNKANSNPNARIAITKYDCTDIFVALAAEWAMRVLAKASGHKLTVTGEFHVGSDAHSADSSGDPCK